MLPRSQREQMSTSRPQPAHRNSRAVARSPPWVRYCPRIRASRTRVGHGADTNLPVVDRRRACPQGDRTLAQHHCPAHGASTCQLLEGAGRGERGPGQKRPKRYRSHAQAIARAIASMARSALLTAERSASVKTCLRQKKRRARAQQRAPHPAFPQACSAEGARAGGQRWNSAPGRSMMARQRQALSLTATS